MNTCRSRRIFFIAVAGLFLAGSARGEEMRGRVKAIDPTRNVLVLEQTGVRGPVSIRLPANGLGIEDGKGNALHLADLRPGMRVSVTPAVVASRIVREAEPPRRSVPEALWNNIRHNLFKPLLLFFYLGFLVPILGVKFEFPYAMYQAVTIYLLLAIGWKGGEELSELSAGQIGPVLGFMLVGFAANTLIGLFSYGALGLITRLRRIDRATIAGFYGSDSAGTFVTCIGVLTAANIAIDAYMPVMLAVMEVPGCLVALAIVSRLRARGMDALGNMPGELGHSPGAAGGPAPLADSRVVRAVLDEEELSLEKMNHEDVMTKSTALPTERRLGPFNLKLLHEVFLNPGLYLLFGGILIGFISRLQGVEVTRDDDNFFIVLFQGVLCLFLLEMGMTASRKLRDLRTAGIGYIAFGLIAPNVFATFGILAIHAYSRLTGTPFEPGTYVLFAVLCGSASYIAVPAVQRLAIPEASPTLPLAASLGLTFTYNVTIGIPVYIEIARLVRGTWPAA